MNYGRDVPALQRVGQQFVATAGTDAVWLCSDAPLVEQASGWVGDFTIAGGQRISFSLTHACTAQRPIGEYLPASSLLDTEEFWADWISRCTYSGRWESDVKRSLILLKALTYAPTGGILAAATTSLPERIGGSRNWDYRFSWLRDASFALQAFISTGYLEEARAWRAWLLRAVLPNPRQVQIMYGVDGARHLPEQTLDWLPGYAGSTPVRIGNDAATQQQNDVWGEVLDSLHTLRDAGSCDLSDVDDLENVLLANLIDTWHQPDSGLWEMRGPRRHFVHSKLMAWVGIDRTVRAIETGHREGPLVQLMVLRARIHDEIIDRGFDTARGAFAQSYGSGRLDAAVLLMPRYGFLPPAHPRMVSTVDAIQRGLTRDGFVLRYSVSDGGKNVDGVPGNEGVFLACSFWLVDALHGIGRTDEAAALFERLLSLRNDVGLLSEEYDPASGRHLGNTPQAFSHAGLITSAVQLSLQPTLSAIPAARSKTIAG